MDNWVELLLKTKIILINKKSATTNQRPKKKSTTTSLSILGAPTMKLSKKQMKLRHFKRSKA